jgi:hypothetical protein
VLAIACRKDWSQLLAFCDSSLGANLPPDRLTLAVAYNKALAAFHVLGGEHADAKAAVAAALELDRWGYATERITNSWPISFNLLSSSFWLVMKLEYTSASIPT